MKIQAKEKYVEEETKILAPLEQVGQWFFFGTQVPRIGQTKIDFFYMLTLMNLYRKLIINNLIIAK